MRRREFLVGAGTVGMAVGSGCVGLTVDVESDPFETDLFGTQSRSIGLGAESAYFASIKHTTTGGFLFKKRDLLDVTVVSDPPEPVDAVVLASPEDQYDHSVLGTGERRAELVTVAKDITEADRPSLLAVQDGSEEQREWHGGRPIERVPLTIRS